MESEKRKQRDFSGVAMLLLGIAALLVLLLIAYGVLSSNVDLVKRVLGDTSALESADDSSSGEEVDDGLMDSDELIAWLDGLDSARNESYGIEQNDSSADTAATEIPADYEKDYAGADVIVAGDMYASDASSNVINEKPLDDEEQKYVSSGNLWSDNAVG